MYAICIFIWLGGTDAFSAGLYNTSPCTIWLLLSPSISVWVRQLRWDTNSAVRNTSWKGRCEFVWRLLSPFHTLSISIFWAKFSSLLVFSGILIFFSALRIFKFNFLFAQSKFIKKSQIFYCKPNINLTKINPTPINITNGLKHLCNWTCM